MRTTAGYSSKAHDDLVLAVKNLAVTPVAVGRCRSEALMAKQEASYVARVRGLIVDCDFVLHCTQANLKDYSWEQKAPRKDGCPAASYAHAILRDIVLKGIRDPDISKVSWLGKGSTGCRSPTSLRLYRASSWHMTRSKASQRRPHLLNIRWLPCTVWVTRRSQWANRPQDPPRDDNDLGPHP